MNDILNNFFSAVAGLGNEGSFLLAFLSLYISGIVLVVLIDPITETKWT